MLFLYDCASLLQAWCRCSTVNGKCFVTACPSESVGGKIGSPVLIPVCPYICLPCTGSLCSFAFSEHSDDVFVTFNLTMYKKTFYLIASNAVLAV